MNRLPVQMDLSYHLFPFFTGLYAVRLISLPESRRCRQATGWHISLWRQSKSYRSIFPVIYGFQVSGSIGSNHSGIIVDLKNSTSPWNGFGLYVPNSPTELTYVSFRFIITDSSRLANALPHGGEWSARCQNQAADPRGCPGRTLPGQAAQ